MLQTQIWLTFGSFGIQFVHLPTLLDRVSIRRVQKAYVNLVNRSRVLYDANWFYFLLQSELLFRDTAYIHVAAGLDSLATCIRIDGGRGVQHFADGSVLTACTGCVVRLPFSTQWYWLWPVGELGALLPLARRQFVTFPMIGGLYR